MKHRMGRPPKPVEERQSYFLPLPQNVRVTPGQADALYRKARRRGQSLSQMIRDLLLSVVQKEHGSESGPTIGS